MAGAPGKPADAPATFGHNILWVRLHIGHRTKQVSPIPSKSQRFLFVLTFTRVPAIF
jgi:hypothetical protein